VFAIVPGALIADVTAPNKTLTARTNVTVSGESFTYAQQETAAASGGIFFRVPYPGTYRIGNSTVVVNETSVINGLRVRTEDRRAL